MTIDYKYLYIHTYHILYNIQIYVYSTKLIYIHIYNIHDYTIYKHLLAKTTTFGEQSKTKKKRKQKSNKKLC